MTLTLAQAAAVLAAQPFSSLIGARITAFDSGSATLEIPIRDELRQQFGLVHGGVLAYAADNALTFAGGSILGPNVLTAGFTITYLRAADGERLRAEATVTTATARQALCRCEIYSEAQGRDPILCAAAQGTTRLVQPS
ncbi:PaaI family thioesterase [Antrihabitans cavernicola]|uniref:Medium/long-chain acyl-CoA thioesterase YigI n=1 Tax=Antrihabitans cavernicola TaxID=2495913 RepID=A0A5A7SAL5_9NOCA|nr:PaaI family thioesterase [Spelaeibacter cavernicola]KAA0021251.1 PaaI family thioesterase [Spelaeibacter cavernicola]